MQEIINIDYFNKMGDTSFLITCFFLKQISRFEEVNEDVTPSGNFFIKVKVDIEKNI